MTNEEAGLAASRWTYRLGINSSTCSNLAPRPGGTSVSFADESTDLFLPSANLLPLLFADSTTLGLAISATTLESTAAGDRLWSFFIDIDQSSQNGRNYAVLF